jgi:hypothetical protein
MPKNVQKPARLPVVDVDTGSNVLLPQEAAE